MTVVMSAHIREWAMRLHRFLKPHRLPALPRVSPWSILLGGLLTLPGATSAQVAIDWVEYTNGNSIAVDAGDNVYTVYYVYNPGGDISLTKRDGNGTLQWVATYDNTDLTKWENSTWVAVDHSGNIVVTGDVNSGYSNPVKANSILMKYDPEGNLLWRIVYEGFFDGTYTKKCLIDDADNIYVLGTGHGPAGYATKVKKFSPNGAALWSYVDEDGIGLPVNFKFTPDGGIVITARSVYGSVNGYAKIDMNGNRLWSYPGVYSLTVGDAAGDLSGNSYLVHAEYVMNGGTILKKVSPTGTLLWENEYDLAGFRVEVGSDNHAVVSGFPNQNTFGSSFIKVAPDGTLLWANPDADGPYALMLHALMLLDENDNAYLAAGTLFEMAVCKVNSDGTSAWTMTMPGSYAYAFCFGSENSLFVVGGTTVRLTQDSPNGEPPVVSDIPAQTISSGGRFAPIRADNFVADPDDPDADIVWSWTGNSALRITFDPVRRRITVRSPRNWTGSETVIFTATDPDGNSDSDEATFTVNPAAAGFEAGVSSHATGLNGSHPNPFNPKTTIRYSLARQSHVSIVVYNVLGEEITVLVDGFLNEGTHEAVFNAAGLPSGTYFCRLRTGEDVDTMKLILAK